MTEASALRAAVDTEWEARARRLLKVIFAAAVAVSIVHYTDNYFNYHDYPRSKTLPNPSAFLVALGWFAFTASGVVGYVLFMREPSKLSLIFLALYSGSGLIGFAHYSIPGAIHMPWWRQAHIVADITCGIAMVAFVFWAQANGRREGRW